MKISLCFPVKGRTEFFKQALASVLLQGHQDVELVIKDGDPEHPVAADPDVAKLLEFFPGRVNYVAARDGGIFPAVNDCFKRATGDILYFACDDDLLCPGALAGVNEVFEAERYPTVFWLYGKTVSADISGKKLGVDGEATTYGQMLEKNHLGQPAVFWSRGLYDLVGGFDPRYRDAADYDLWLRFYERREPMFLNQELGVHRHHDGQASRVNAKRLEREARRISDRHACLSGEIRRARNTFTACREYGGAIPAMER